MSLAKFLLHITVVAAWAVGVALFAGATAVVWPFALWWWEATDLSNAWLEGAARGALGFATYLLWGLALLTIVVLVRTVSRLSVPAGRFPMRSWAMARFYFYNVLILMARYFFLPMTRTTQVNIAFYRGMGARIGERTVVNTAHVYDCNLLTIGKDVTIGGSAVILCHVGQGNDVYIAPVTIEDGASVGEMAIVMPGVTIGAGAVVGAGSVVPKDSVLPPGSKWAGVPIRRIESASVE